MNSIKEPSWQAALADELAEDYFKKLTHFVEQEYSSVDVYPPRPLLFRAFEACPFDKVNIVILGQDPYHGPGQAEGLSFSVPAQIPIPRSLRNIYKEIIADIGGVMPATGNLESWAEQGVLLLNATLTVRAHDAGSHQGRGWEQFTDTVIETISRQKEHVVFILWGNFARSKKKLIDESRHLVLEAAHPSPLSARAFFGCRHFSKANAYLVEHNKKEIVWI